MMLIRSQVEAPGGILHYATLNEFGVCSVNSVVRTASCLQARLVRGEGCTTVIPSSMGLGCLAGPTSMAQVYTVASAQLCCRLYKMSQTLCILTVNPSLISNHYLIILSGYADDRYEA